MTINTLKELIDWTRDRHGQMARCLSEAAENHNDEMTRGLLSYLAGHETDLARKVDEFEHLGTPLELATRDYDYLSHHASNTLVPCHDRLVTLEPQQISQEVLGFHNDIIGLYEGLARRVVVPDMQQLLQQLLEMEEVETRRMATQVGRMESL